MGGGGLSTHTGSTCSFLIIRFLTQSTLYLLFIGFCSRITSEYLVCFIFSGYFLNSVILYSWSSLLCFQYRFMDCLFYTNSYFMLLSAT